MFKKLLLCAALILSSHTALAVVVYDGGAPDKITAYIADTDFFYSATGTNNKILTNITFNSMTWWGLDFANSPGAASFTLSIFDGSSGTPGVLLHSTSIGGLTDNLTGDLIFSGLFAEHIYTGTFAPINLLAGTYFFQLSNDDSDPSDLWGWETTSAPGLNQGYSFDGTSYAITGQNLAFNLSNTLAVPEPETWLSLMAGLAIMGMVTRRKSRV